MSVLFIGLFQVCILLILTFLQVTIIESFIGNSFKIKNCDVASFYKPYVKILRNRLDTESPNEILNGLGFLDLRNKSGYLCVNGPVVLYKDVKKEKDHEIWIPGEPILLSHDCFVFNKERKYPLKSSHLIEKKNSEVNRFGEDNYVGDRLAGIVLAVNNSKAGDYRAQGRVFFAHPNFGYENVPAGFNNSEVGSSAVIMTGTEDGKVVLEDPVTGQLITQNLYERRIKHYCINITSQHHIGYLNVKLKKTPNFCTWSIHESTGWEQDILRRVNIENNTHSNFCSEELRDSDIEASSSYSSDISKMVELPDMSTEDFRTINPDDQGAEGSIGIPFEPRNLHYFSSNALEELGFFSRPRLPQYYSSDESKNETGDLAFDFAANISPSLYFNAFQPKIKSEDNSIRNEDDKGPSFLPIYNIEIRNCEEVPSLKNACLGDDPIAKNDTCKLLNYALTLDEVDWSKPGYNIASWRVPILNTITDIFNKICPEVSEIMAGSVSRIIQYYLKTALTGYYANGTGSAVQNKEWTYLKLELKRCHDLAVPLDFRRVRDKEAEKELQLILQELADPKLSSELYDELKIKLEHRRLKFPYKIKLKKDKSLFDLFYFEEAAEFVYELDWALDAHWKVFTAVIGYCYSNYEAPKQTLLKLYSRYSEDFLYPIMDFWTTGSSSANSVFHEIFGEFVKGVGGYWLDSCMEGAYIQSDVPSYRPLRPIFLTNANDGENASKETNFFVSIPNAKPK